MADETTELDLDEVQDNPQDKRIKDLSGKVRTIAEERDEALKKAEASEADKASQAKEIEFLKSFNTLSPKYPGASEYQDQIREKVLAGYDSEDAVVAVLNKEGKLTPEASEVPEPEFPAGGSAVNTVKEKSGEMTTDEKRAKLMENEDAVRDILSPKIRT